MNPAMQMMPMPMMMGGMMPMTGMPMMGMPIMGCQMKSRRHELRDAAARSRHEGHVHEMLRKHDEHDADGHADDDDVHADESVSRL